MTEKPLNLGPIKARDAARMQGEWLNEQQIVGEAEPRLINCPEGADGSARFLATNLDAAVAAFIASASVDVPALIAEVERLRLELAQREEMAADLTERLFQEGKRCKRLREGLNAAVEHMIWMTGGIGNPTVKGDDWELNARIQAGIDAARALLGKIRWTGRVKPSTAKEEEERCLQS